MFPTSYDLEHKKGREMRPKEIRCELSHYSAGQFGPVARFFFLVRNDRERRTRP